MAKKITIGKDVDWFPRYPQEPIRRLPKKDIARRVQLINDATEETRMRFVLAKMGMVMLYAFRLQDGREFRCVGDDLRDCRLQRNRWLNDEIFQKEV
jgi:hypothetical protein